MPLPDILSMYDPFSLPKNPNMILLRRFSERNWYGWESRKGSWIGWLLGELVGVMGVMGRRCEFYEVALENSKYYGLFHYHYQCNLVSLNIL